MDSDPQLLCDKEWYHFPESEYKLCLDNVIIYKADSDPIIITYY